MNQKKSQIEIELIENQINNTNYDVQPFNGNKASSSNRDNGEKDVDNSKDDEPKQKISRKSKVEPTVYNDKYKERKDDEGEEEDKDDNGSIVPPLENHFNQQYSDSEDSDSDSDSEN